MKKSRREKDFLPSPEYPGGLTAMRKFIAKELKYPEAAIQAGITGSVYIRYGINNKGKVVETKVISSLGHGCDEEAERLVRMMRFEVSRIRNLRIMYHKKIRVWFRKPTAKKASTNTTVQYNLTPNNKTVAAPKKSGSYNYTIKIG